MECDVRIPRRLAAGRKTGGVYSVVGGPLLFQKNSHGILRLIPHLLCSGDMDAKPVLLPKRRGQKSLMFFVENFFEFAELAQFVGSRPFGNFI